MNKEKEVQSPAPRRAWGSFYSGLSGIAEVEARTKFFGHFFSLSLSELLSLGHLLFVESHKPIRLIQPAAF